MDLSTLTSAQYSCVTHVTGPLAVSAGAGSGKTSMLTRRIVYSFLEESGPCVDDIDRILAITFTDKAAGEIKSRVKAALRENGFVDQAVRVDGAWISTIHGMCSRIIREHALEIGIDPRFEVLDDQLRDTMISEAIEAELAANPASYEALSDLLPARTQGGPGSSLSIESVVSKWLAAAASHPRGIDALEIPPAPTPPLKCLAYLQDCYLQAEAACHTPGNTQKGIECGETYAEAADTLRRTIDALVKDVDDSDGDLWSRVRDVVADMPKILLTSGSKDARAALREVRETSLASLIAEVAYGCRYEATAQARDLTKRVHAVVDHQKRKLGYLDNDDLLIVARDALRDVPSIAREYENRFELVMVDEFQDTSALQVELISYLCGANMQRLCTVGDAEQSIYRFRGADVDVFRHHKQRMSSDDVGARCVELNRNFRSHHEVLDFVDSLFLNLPGDDFMQLSPRDDYSSNYCGDLERICVVNNPSGATVGSAEAIAERFEMLRDKGNKAGDMVILLSSLKGADPYADALRRRGFECVIAGGSQFSSTIEAQLVRAALAALADYHDTNALVNVAASPMFELDQDDLLRLTTRVVDGNTFSQSLDEGLMAWSLDATYPRIDRFVSAFRNALFALKPGKAASALGDIIDSSGWLKRLKGQGGQGMASAANVLKALRIIEQHERDEALGIATLSRSFTALLDAEFKESPGALSGSGDDVVRIMTIHASKGLEFPIVAVGDFKNSKRPTQCALNLGEKIVVFIAPPKNALGASIDPENLESTFSSSYCERLLDEGMTLDGEEARRKFYVALTRAKDALVVQLNRSTSLGAECLEILGLTNEETSAESMTFDGSGQTATYVFVGKDNDASFDPSDASSDPDAAISDSIITLDRRESPLYVRASRSATALYSYTSLSRFAPHDRSAVVAHGDAAVPSEDNATDFGTAFHLLAQRFIMDGQAPDDVVVERICRHLHLHTASIARVRAALDAWFADSIFTGLMSHAHVRAEVPFSFALDRGTLEGEIDALAFDSSECAYVIDYKTGGSEAESMEALKAKHALQARCYACALLGSGFKRVDFTFVRVEQFMPDGSLQTVRFEFDATDFDELASGVSDLMTLASEN